MSGSSDGRKVVYTAKYGSITIDVVEVNDEVTGMSYLDYRTSRETPLPNGGSTRSAYCRRFDIYDNVKALGDIQKWLAGSRG